MSDNNRRVWGTGVSKQGSKDDIERLYKEQQINRDERAKYYKELSAMKPLKKVKHNFKALHDAANICSERAEDKKIDEEYEL